MYNFHCASQSTATRVMAGISKRDGHAWRDHLLLLFIIVIVSLVEEGGGRKCASYVTCNWKLIVSIHLQFISLFFQCK